MDTIGSDQEKTSAVKQPAESAASGPAIPLGQDGDSQFSTPHAPSPEMNPAGETNASASQDSPAAAEPENAGTDGTDTTAKEAAGEETASGDSPETSSGSGPENTYGTGEELIDENSTQHNSAFRLLGRITPLTLLLFLAAVCWPVFLIGDSFCPGEALNIKFFSSVAQSPLLPQADGAVALPGFAWLGALVLKCVPAPAMGLSVVSALGAFICLLGVWGVCPLLRLGRYTPLAAGLALFCTPAFLAFSQFVGPVLTATGLSLLALGILGHAWTKDMDFPGMILGNLMAAAAGLTGGLLYALLPVISAFLLCLWRCDFRRSRQPDALIGFAVFLFTLAIWAALTIIFSDGAGSSSIAKSLIRLPSEPSVTGNALRLYALGSLPAILVIFCCNWPKILRGSLASLKASRTAPKTAILWIGLFVTLGLTVLTPHAADVFPAIAITAILAGRALLRLGKIGNRAFFIFVTLTLLAAGFSCAAATIPSLQHWVASTLGLPLDGNAEKILADLADISRIKTIVFTALPVISAAIILHVVWRSSTAAAGLLVTAVMVVVMAQPFGLFVAPSLREMPSLQLKTFEHLNDTAPVAPKDTSPIVTGGSDYMWPNYNATVPGSPAQKPQPQEKASAPAASGKTEPSAAPASPLKDKEQPGIRENSPKPSGQAPSGSQNSKADQYSSVLQQKPAAPGASQNPAAGPQSEQKETKTPENQPSAQEKAPSEKQPEADQKTSPAPRLQTGGEQTGTAI